MNQAITDFKETADFLREYSDMDIYTDFDTRGKLNFLLGYERVDNMKDLEWVESPDEIKNAFVIIYASRGFVEVEEFRNSLPSFVYNPPDNWEIVKNITGAYIDVYGTYDPIIYYVPP